MAFQLYSLTTFLLFTLCSSRTQQVTSDLVLEDGYTVSTVIDGNKLSNHINPSSILPRFGKTKQELIILDTPNSAFYAITFPISNDSEINRVSGNSTAGFSDGDLVSSMFDRPRSFALDTKGNVYVADKNNHVIRKISKQGVTTIAGGYTRKPGKADGPAQYASFSEDFELVYVPELCSLLISDRGNRLVRKIGLKPEDCTTGSGLKLGMSWGWMIFFGVFCFALGSGVTFAAYQFLPPREIFSNSNLNAIWKHYQINLGKRVLIVCSAIKNVVARLPLYVLIVKIVRISLSYLSLVIGFNIVEKRKFCRNPVPLVDSDGLGEIDVPNPELKDLINFDAEFDLSENDVNQIDGDDDRDDVKTCRNQRIDSMIESNIMDFGVQARERNRDDGFLKGSSGVVRRK